MAFFNGLLEHLSDCCSARLDERCGVHSSQGVTRQALTRTGEIDIGQLFLPASKGWRKRVMPSN